MKAIIVLLLAAVILVPVYISASRTPDVHQIGTQPSSRFTLVHQEEVQDFGASNGKRHIYILTDTKTGTEYVGVSGIGISEIRGGRLPAGD